MKVPVATSLGLTLIELLIVLSLFTFLLLLTNINLTNILPRASLKSSASTFVSDFKAQQINAMIGNAPNGTDTPHGIHLDQNSYTIFHTPTYSSSENSNTTFSLNQGISFDLSGLPDSTFIFERLTGDLSNPATPPHNIVMLNNTTNETITFVINELGVIESITY